MDRGPSRRAETGRRHYCICVSIDPVGLPVLLGVPRKRRRARYSSFSSFPFPLPFRRSAAPTAAESRM